ncbi:hypothetical protein [Parapedobacter tibetensis]|uniref:hypothetical protein n=1 Tax=Parapedobacter tibetensis TaxID=2972951 RepID=UPI00214D5439|nr:hypothetical protein [Parapedobacter tibetensis]
MKSLVLCAMICAAAIGNGTASTYGSAASNKESKKELSGDSKSIEAFKEQMAFHQRNVDVLWNQYALEEARIKESRGNHAELERDKAFFTNVYQQDLDKGIRVEESKKAIAEIAALYTEKHAERDVFENKKIARLQALLKTELNKEMKRFEVSKKKYARLLNELNEQTLPILREVEEHFARSIERVAKFDDREASTVAIL